MPIILDVAVMPMIGVIVGMWVAIIAVAVVAIALIIKLCRKRKERRERDNK